MTNSASLQPSGGSLLARRIGLWAGPLLFFAILLSRPLALAPGGNEVVAIAAWMLCWWVLEAVPLAVTALLPMVLLSLTGVMSLDEALRPYSSKIVYLFFGGFMLALGLEAHGLHQRIALLIIRVVGTSPPRLILGFLLSTALLSMWISNTATAVMMLPMALSVLGLLSVDAQSPREQSPREQSPREDAVLRKNFSTALVLSIAYGASIGGMGTVIGTPPNLVMRGHFESVLGTPISFFAWMYWAIPIVFAILIVTYFLLAYVLFPCQRLVFTNAQEAFDAQRSQLGPMRAVHWRMLAVFLATATLWMFSGIIKPFLPIVPLTGQPIPLSDEVIGICAAIALFIVPGEGKQGKGLLDWEATRRLPWGILLLFGGGLSMAGGLEKTGVIQMLSERMESLSGGNTVALLVLLTALALYLTEVMSNVAMVQVLVPVVAALAIGIGEDPLKFAVPVTLASSCAFMLPMGTPPNAIVFSSGHLTIRRMIAAGFWLNLFSLVIIIAICNLLVGTSQ